MKIKLFLSTLAIIFFSNSLMAQEGKTTLQINVPVIAPGLSVEFPIYNNFTLHSRAALSGGFGGVLFDDIFYVIEPRYFVQSRYYLGGVKSETKSGKGLKGNSGYYAFLGIQGSLKPIAASYNLEEASSSYAIGAGVGLQRTYTNRFSWGFAAGYGVHSSGGLTFMGDIMIGINLYTKTK